MATLHLWGLKACSRGSENPSEVIGPAQQAQNTTMGGIGADVLTLTLPVRKPDVAVPVVELFLKPEW